MPFDTINFTTGFRYGGAATSGNYARGDGTNFVSANLDLDDVPNASSASARLLAILSDETGSGLAVFGTSPTLTTPVISGAVSFPDGVRQTFNPDGTNAGLNVGGHAGDPGSPSNGDLWYDSSANELTARINGANVALGAGGGSGDSVSVNTSAATDADFTDGDIDWTLNTGTSPDQVTATVGCSGCIDATDLASNSVEAAEITADAVTEAKLKAVDAASDEECLTYETTTGDFEWQSCGSGGTAKPWERFSAQQAFLPASSFATHDTRNTHPVLDFDAAADECAYFGGVLNTTYAGGGVSVTLYWMATSATTGAAGWLVAVEAHPDDALDLDSDSFASDQSSSATTASASGELQYTTITFTDGAQMDSLAAGESYRIRVCRDGDGSVVTDDMTGDAELYKVVVRES